MALDHTLIPQSELPTPLHAFFEEGGITNKRTVLLARGMAPGLGPADLLTGLYQASVVADTKIADAARKSAEEVPDNVLQGALNEALHPLVLDFFSILVSDKRELLERIVLNQATADETIERLARKVSGERILEMIAANQMRLLRFPKIIESLYLNPKTRMSTANRCVELAVREGITLEIEAFKEIAASIGHDEKHDDPGDQALADMEKDQDFADAWKEAHDKAHEGEDEHEHPEPVKLSQLSVSDKIRMATIGAAHIRWSLIRDSNRTVAMAAIKSPLIKETEIVRITQSRAVSDDVIRYVAHNREWLKLHTIKVNLVNNPKCPLPTAMRLLPHLRKLELKQLARSKDIPNALRTQAKNMLRKKGH